MNKNKHNERKEKTIQIVSISQKRKKEGVSTVCISFCIERECVRISQKKSKGGCLHCLHFFLYRKRMIVVFFVESFFVFSKS